jgi:hypothetical protein
MCSHQARVAPRPLSCRHLRIAFGVDILEGGVERGSAKRPCRGCRKRGEREDGPRVDGLDAGGAGWEREACQGVPIAGAAAEIAFGKQVRGGSR